MSLEDKENCQKNFISNEEHKDRMERIKVFASRGSIKSSIAIDENNILEKEKSKEIIDSIKPQLEPIPDTSHLKKKVNR